jgi:hypothetical protein
LTFVPEDLVAMEDKTGTTKLGSAVVLKFFQLEARFPLSPDQVPEEMVDAIARQLGVRFDARTLQLGG